MKKEITVQELIDQLNKIENKNIPIDGVLVKFNPIRFKKGDHIEIESILLNPSYPSGSTVSVSIGLGLQIEHEEVCDSFKTVEHDPNFKDFIDRMTIAFKGDRREAIEYIDREIRWAIIHANEFVSESNENDGVQNNA